VCAPRKVAKGGDVVAMRRADDRRRQQRCTPRDKRVQLARRHTACVSGNHGRCFDARYDGGDQLFGMTTAPASAVVVHACRRSHQPQRVSRMVWTLGGLFQTRSVKSARTHRPVPERIRGSRSWCSLSEHRVRIENKSSHRYVLAARRALGGHVAPPIVKRESDLAKGVNV
jgi:hypothetical protein